jgi:glycosyltransferase involved in cell wall biosynthesis
MKVMYVCGMYVPSHGGAEISMYSLLKKLQENFKWDIIAITDQRYKKTKELKEFNKIRLHTIPHDNREKEIEKMILEFNPDVIMTQLMWSDVALRLANKHSIPSIMRVCKVPIELNLSKSSEYAPTAIISTSNSVKKYVSRHWNRQSNIIKPLVETENYIIHKQDFDPSKNNLIFMFNPLQRKGGLIFNEIAKKLPFEKFSTVLGWSSLKEKKGSNNFSSKYIERITESEGSAFDGSLPDYVCFDYCKNIKIFPSEDDPRILYKQMKILLIPSQWEEAFGRVAIEAMVNGIPVIASDIAGLKESVGKGGILLKKDDIDSWVNEIKKLQNKEYYKKISIRCKDWVKKNYSEEKIINQTAELIKQIIKPPIQSIY